MRLINCTTGEFEEFYDTQLPDYAILSHRWENEEVSLEEMKNGKSRSKNGSVKVQFCCEKALSWGLNYVWVDTCCIDKTSSAELSEAINSMYNWYRNSEVCFAYLSDVSQPEDVAKSTWFTRGWTLQELIAPNDVQFFSKTWTWIGNKKTWSRQIAAVTGISENVISGLQRPSQHSVAQRMTWAAARVTTRSEDRAYCLLGLFEINMPLLYGEGGERAFRRLQKEIINESVDKTILLWDTWRAHDDQILALSPEDFHPFSGDRIMHQAHSDEPANSEFSVTNYGMKVSLNLAPWSFNVYLALPDCYCLPGQGPIRRLTVGFFVAPGIKRRRWKRLNCKGKNDQDERIYHRSSLIVNTTEELRLTRQIKNMTILLDGFGIDPINIDTPYGLCIGPSGWEVLLTSRSLSLLGILGQLFPDNTMRLTPGSSTLACVFALEQDQTEYDMMMLGFDFFFNPVIVFLQNTSMETRYEILPMLEEARGRQELERSRIRSLKPGTQGRQSLELEWLLTLEADETSETGHPLVPRPKTKVYRCEDQSAQWKVILEEVGLDLCFCKLDSLAGLSGWVLYV